MLCYGFPSPLLFNYEWREIFLVQYSWLDFIWSSSSSAGCTNPCSELTLFIGQGRGRYDGFMELRNAEGGGGRWPRKVWEPLLHGLLVCWNEKQYILRLHSCHLTLSLPIVGKRWLAQKCFALFLGTVAQPQALVHLQRKRILNRRGSHRKNPTMHCTPLQV